MHSIALLLALATAPTAAPPPASACDAAEHHQFDFWIGDWSVVGKKAGKVVGHSRISTAAAGCVIVEEWTAPGADSRSLNLYNRNLGAWEQFWVDSQGNRLQLQGGLHDGAMVLETPPNADGSTLHRHDRITWSADAQGRVRQLWETSIDGGEWAVQFDGLYSREVGGAATR
jgi:hypothetical protein